MQGPVSRGFDNPASLDPAKLTADEKWIIAWMNKTAVSVGDSLREYKFHMAAHDVYEVVWNTFCDWFIESCKPRLYAGGEEKEQALRVLDFVLWEIIRMLHPFMPFVTEELAHQMDFVADGESIMYAPFPKSLKFLGFEALQSECDKVLAQVEDKYELIRSGRNLRVSYDIAPGKKINYHIKAATADIEKYLKSDIESLKFLLNAESVTISLDEYKADDGGSAPSLLVKAGAIYLPLKGVVDVAAERAKLEKQKKDLLGWIKGSESKLANQGFVAKAPPKVIEDVKTLLAEHREKLARVEDAMKTLG